LDGIIDQKDKTNNTNMVDVEDFSQNTYQIHQREIEVNESNMKLGDNCNSIKSGQDEQKETSQQNSLDDENALVREIKKFMETEGKESTKLIDQKEENIVISEKELKIVDENDDSVICDFKTSEPKSSDQIIVNGTENDEGKNLSETDGSSSEGMECNTHQNEFGLRPANVLNTLENVVSRKSESRMSVKKRKQKNSIKDGDQLPGLIDSEERSDTVARPKSKEVFDFYANSIDQDTISTESKISTQNGIPENTVKSDKVKSDEHLVIENMLNTIQKDMSGGNRLDEKEIQENDGSSTENGTVFEKLEETETYNASSTCTSGANTLRRSWKRKNSKKKRKSQHIL